MASDKIRQQTVVAQVMGEIRELIASNAYATGDKIPTEKELAQATPGGAHGGARGSTEAPEA